MGGPPEFCDRVLHLHGTRCPCGHHHTTLQHLAASVALLDCAPGVVEVAELVRVHDRDRFGDLAISPDEHRQQVRPAIAHHVGARLSVDLDPVELVGREPLAPGEVHQQLRHLRRAAHRTTCRVMIGTTVGDVDHVVGQHRGQLVDVTLHNRREERIGQFAHLGGRRGQPGTTVSNLIPGSTRHLPGRSLVPDGGDRHLGERYGEHVVDEEHRSPDRVQRLEYPQEPQGECVRRRTVVMR